MSTPVATVAEALIAFILSLLRDPEALEEFAAAPQATMQGNGLGDVCGADVRAVKPIVVDHPSVTPKPPGPPVPPPPNPPDVIKEITSIVNQFTSIDNRSTIVDQSVNQNIWTEGGDVLQIFDQEAVVASGDQSVAAGEDATIVDSDVDVTIGDVAIGNTVNDSSFNTTGAGSESEAAAAESDGSSETAAAVAGETVSDAVDAALAATSTATTAATGEDPLAADLTSGDVYEGDLGGGEDDLFVEEPVEEQ